MEILTPVTIPPTRLNFFGFLAPFEKLLLQLKREPINEKPDFLFSNDKINTLNDMRNDNNIVIMKLDKGNGIVISNKVDYDRTKFQ